MLTRRYLSLYRESLVSLVSGMLNTFVISEKIKGSLSNTKFSLPSYCTILLIRLRYCSSVRSGEIISWLIDLMNE